MFFNTSVRTFLMTCAVMGLAQNHAAWAHPYHAPHTSNREGAGQPVSFSAEQVAHGAQIYAKSCAACHGADLAGGHDVPDLNDYFAARWANTPLDRLADAIASMPLMAPAPLPPQDTAALVAFILHHNGVASATNAPLPMEDARLAKIRFPAPQPPTTGSRP